MSNHCVMMSNHYCIPLLHPIILLYLHYEWYQLRESFESFADQFHEANVQLGRDAELQSLAESRDPKIFNDFQSLN